MNPASVPGIAHTDALAPERPAGQYAYPPDLARLVVNRWHQARNAGQISLLPPAISALERILSICYQATLLREEGRPVSFRLAVHEPDAFAPGAGPPSGLHRLVFNRRLPLDQHELRRLAPAAVFSRALIGATLRGATGPEIWGVIHSGLQWLQSVRGGRQTAQTIPPVLIVVATGPGRLRVSVGAVTLAELRNGTLSGREMDVFASRWMQEKLAGAGQALPVARARLREHSRDEGAGVPATFGGVLAGHVLRRVLATIRGAQHGGTLIIVPGGRVSELLSGGRYVRVKYGFNDEEPRRRILTLMASIVNELARHEKSDDALIEWSRYEGSRSQRLSEMDEALFEVAHLVADLTRVDGTVVMTDSLEIVGFGVEIAGDMPDVLQVARAHDLDGSRREWVRTDRVGTRHRSAYRLCQAVHDALALVISQDGSLRFIRWHDDGVTYWEQVTTGLWDM